MTPDKPKPDLEKLGQAIAELKRQEKAKKHARLMAIGEALLAEHHFTTPEPIVCKWCGSKDIKKYGTRKGVQEYICLKCRRKFIDKDAPYRKQTPTELIGTSISSYYDGMSFADVARHLAETGNPVNESTVYRWVMHYTTKAIQACSAFKPEVSDIWVVDETVVKVEGGKLWFWDVIDEKTRFLLASHLTKSQTTIAAKTLMERAGKRAGKAPKFILSDCLAAYIDGIEQAFGADSKHIQCAGLTHEINTNLIERFHGTIKERTKVMRGFKTVPTATLILEGFLVHYNFFRPHMTLKGKTPAEVAKVKYDFKTWTDFVRSDK